MNLAWVSDAFRAASSVATPIALVAFVAVLVLLGFLYYLHHKRKQLDSTPKNKRADLIDEYLTRYKIKADDLSEEAREKLIRDEMKGRERRLIYILVFALLVFVLAVVAFLTRNSPLPPKPVPPPEEFSFITCQTADDPNLPTDIFGHPGDDVQQLRQWMRVMDSGGIARMKGTRDDTVELWLLTNEFDEFHTNVDLHVYARTTQKVIISAFLVVRDGRAQLSALPRLPDSGNGLYQFNVPEIRPSDRIIVFLAMKKSAYEAIVGDKKFHLRSKPLKA